MNTGSTYGGVWDGWYGPDDRQGDYSTDTISSSPAGRALKAIGHAATPVEMLSIRNSSDVTCKSSTVINPCKPLRAPCLFNIKADPCEQDNLADR